MGKAACSLAAALLTGVRGASAHMTFIDVRSQIACDIWEGRGNNINWLAQPILEGQPFEEWWMHGQKDCQDKARGAFELPARGTAQVALASRPNKVPPPFGRGDNWKPKDPDFIPPDDEWDWFKRGDYDNVLKYNNIHAYERNDTSGCAFAIAYESDAAMVQPEDFVVFSVLHDCIKRQRETIEVPNLPACPNGKCICAWFWIPKNSGTKNFYMTPFVCTVTGARRDASPVDVEYAIPPRRCLNPKNCNFGPRQPLYWLGTGKQINMPEAKMQSPHYSIRYGFREGAQHDIFVDTNPRRYKRKSLPSERQCGNGKSSRIFRDHYGDWEMTSPNCECTAKVSNGTLAITDYRKGSHGRQVYTHDVGSSFGPRWVVENDEFKAGRYYFPKGNPEKAYRMDLDNECYLYVTDSDGVVVWESMFDEGMEREYIVNTFTGRDPDPSIWPDEKKALRVSRKKNRRKINMEKRKAPQETT